MKRYTILAISVSFLFTVSLGAFFPVGMPSLRKELTNFQDAYRQMRTKGFTTCNRSQKNRLLLGGAGALVLFGSLVSHFSGPLDGAPRIVHHELFNGPSPELPSNDQENTIEIPKYPSSDSAPKRNLTPLQRAVTIGFVADVQRLIASGADLSVTTEQGFTLMDLACGNEDVQKLLAVHGVCAGIQYPNVESASPRVQAVIRDRLSKNKSVGTNSKWASQKQEPPLWPSEPYKPAPGRTGELLAQLLA